MEVTGFYLICLLNASLMRTARSFTEFFWVLSSFLGHFFGLHLVIFLPTGRIFRLPEIIVNRFLLGFVYLNLVPSFQHLLEILVLVFMEVISVVYLLFRGCWQVFYLPGFRVLPSFTEFIQKRECSTSPAERP